MDLCEIETKDTKDEQNFSFLSANDLKRTRRLEPDTEEEEKKKQKNNERIMNYIKAKKMQRSNLKKSRIDPIIHSSKNESNYCEQCNIF